MNVDDVVCKIEEVLKREGYPFIRKETTIFADVKLEDKQKIEDAVSAAIKPMFAANKTTKIKVKAGHDRAVINGFVTLSWKVYL